MRRERARGDVAVGICAIALPVGIVSSAFITEVSRHRAGKCPACGRDDRVDDALR